MKRVVIASIVVLLMMAVIAVGYFYYQQVRTPGSESYSAIPPDAAIIAEIKNPDIFWERITSSAEWKTIASQTNVNSINNQLHFLDSLVKNNPEAKELINNKPILVSLHATKATDFDALYVISMPQFKQESFVNELINALSGDKIKLDKRIYNGVSIREFVYNKRNFAYTVYNGLFIGSHTSILVEDAIRQLKTGSNIKSDKNFRRVYEAAGKNVDGHVYVNYSLLSRFTSVYTTSLNDIQVKRLRNFAGWTQLDLNIKSESVLLNGFTIVTDSAQYLYTLQNQKPLAPSIFNILPRRTALFQLISISEVSLYFKNLNAHLIRTGETEKYVINTSTRSQLTSWIGNEICYFITEASSINFNNNVFAAIKASDIAKARKTLKEYGEKSGSGGFREELYRGKIIGFINETNLIPSLLGSKFERINRFFYTYIDDYVIIGNQASSIRSIIDDNLAGRKLSTDDSFMQFQKKLSGESNFYSYINIHRSSYIIKSYATESFINPYELNQSYLNKINSIALQISGNGKLFYTNISFDTGQPSVNGEINVLWASQLDTSVSMQPQLVINHNTNMMEIIVQDDANNLYLIDNGGEILWKRQINEKILSPLYQVDLFKNGKLQLMFNTATRLFLIDRNRNNVGNFPIRLPAEASTAMSLFDYDNNRDYRIFIPCVNGQVYSYLAGGSPSAGWILNRPIGNIFNPVQHFVIDGRDYLVIGTEDGRFLMLDRRGAVRAEAKQLIYQPLNSVVFLEKDENNKHYFVTTDTTGTIFSIFPDGNVFSKTVVPFSPEHDFIFEDINSDQVKDYIFVDNNRISVYNKDNSIVFSEALEQQITGKAGFYQFSTGKGKIGTASVIANEIYLISDDGSMYDGFPLKGSTPFIIDDLNKDGSRKIITGSVDGNIYIYNFE